MSRKCYLCDRKASSEQYISLHKFPKNEILCEKWKYACGILDSDDISHVSLCSIHFKCEFVQIRTQREKPFICLLPTAIPTISVPNVLDIVETLPSQNSESKTFNNSSLNNIEDNEHNERLEQSIVDTTEVFESNDSYPELDMLQVNSCSQSEHVNPDVADLMSPCTIIKKRSSFEPRFVSEIEEQDFSTPKRRKRTIEMIKKVDKEKSLKIKRLQDAYRRQKRRIKSLEELVKHLEEEQMLSCEAAASLMNMVSDEEQNFI